MKKIGLMFMLAGVIAFGFSSCKDDDDNPDNPGTPAKPKPSRKKEDNADTPAPNTKNDEEVAPDDIPF